MKNYKTDSNFYKRKEKLDTENDNSMENDPFENKMRNTQNTMG
jgi:hypothetical protein